MFMYCRFNPLFCDVCLHLKHADIIKNNNLEPVSCQTSGSTLRFPFKILVKVAHKERKVLGLSIKIAFSTWCWKSDTHQCCPQTRQMQPIHADAQRPLDFCQAPQQREERNWFSTTITNNSIESWAGMSNSGGGCNCQSKQEGQHLQVMSPKQSGLKSQSSGSDGGSGEDGVCPGDTDAKMLVQHRDMEADFTGRKWLML